MVLPSPRFASSDFNAASIWLSATEAGCASEAGFSAAGAGAAGLHPVAVTKTITIRATHNSRVRNFFTFHLSLLN
jgi:hypothetical protein